LLLDLFLIQRLNTKVNSIIQLKGNFVACGLILIVITPFII